MSGLSDYRSWIARLTPRVVLGVAVVSLSFGVLGAAPAFAEAPWWQVTSGSAPANLSPGGEGKIIMSVTNLGDAAVNGATTPVTITDKLPSGLTATAISSITEDGSHDSEVVCSLGSLSCTFAGTLGSYEALEVDITVKVAADATSGMDNEVKVVGGRAPGASTSRPVVVSSEQTPFGVENYELTPENEGGSFDTQAGSHPFQLTTTITLNEGSEAIQGILKKSGPTVPSAVKDLHFNLPPGLIGNPTPFPRCTDEEFLGEANEPESGGCPLDTVVGVASVIAHEVTIVGTLHFPVALFNLTPNVGEPARFGFDFFGVHVILDTSVRTGGDYGVVVSVNNINEEATFLESKVTFWGVPGDPGHDQSRGSECLKDTTTQSVSCAPSPAEAHPAPLLTLPTSCTGSLQTSVEADSWTSPGSFLSALPTETEDGLDGCNKLGFEPSISVAPDGPAASTPTGLTVGLRVPQQEGLNPTGLAESDVKDTTVTLPAGVQLSPAAADGLMACSTAQVALESPGGVSCPEASKVGTVKIKSPLLPDPLEGAVYLAAQDENPFGSLVALYLVAEDPTAGVVIKLAGQVTPDPVTGQLVSTFQNTPQLPFEELELHFFGSDRAPLTTPPLCGTYTTETSIAPWSGNTPATPSSSFDVTSGPDEGPCSDPRPFSPGFQAGTTNLQAGAFTPFTLTMSRPDGDQTLASVAMKMPPGLLGTLSNVKLCGEPQAAEGTCGEESLIGHTTVSVGLGGSPFTVEGGKVFITGPYKGAPYGLSIVNPAKAGPFDLEKGTPCDCVVVRASINVDPHTAQLSIQSDPLPTILQGIPLQIQHVNVTIERPGGFTFNPTDCAKTAITGTLSSSEGSTAAVSTPFQVTNCASLAFKPAFAASTSGRTSRAGGASLAVKLTYPKVPQGSEANIAKVKVDLPKQLPSRLTTLQKACTAAQFEANPAGCPTASVVGRAKAITPILPVPLEGPAYFVSHGDEAFPSLIVVLQGYGTTVDLVGSTFISHAGITSSTFKAVPDVPVGSFELTLPEGKYSALAANLPEKDHGNFCGQKLAMPTEFIGQNGAEIHESTPIAVEGCSTSLAFTASIKKKTLTLSVYAPAAGKVTARGKGLTSRTKTAKGQEDVTLTLKQKNTGKLKTTVKVAFTPSTGKDRKKQSKTMKLTFKK